MRSKFFLPAIIFLLTAKLSFAQYTKLFDFDASSTGIIPYYCALISDGTYLYGTTTNGGTSSNGVVFKIKKDGTDYQTLYNFDDTTGAVPMSSLLLLDGYLYGTANSGGDEMNDGTIFKMKTDGTGFTALFYFDRDVTGSKPESSLFYDGVYLYGTCVQGGPNSAGTIYKLKPDGTGFTTIKDYGIVGGGGFEPHGHVISDGNFLYGMTRGGGPENAGTVYKIKPDGTTYEDILDFIDDSTGAWGIGSLVYDGSEYLYGMTNNGGLDNRGTIFKVRTDGTGYEMLLDMNDENGAQPLGSLILVGTTLYGMTELGSEDGDASGNMFSIETDGSNLNILIDFDGENGAIPYGTLLYEDGALFGMTAGGGANNFGVIFRYGDVVEGVDEINISALDIYPNPAENYIVLTLPEIAENDLQVEILNTAGEMMVSETIQTGAPVLNVSNMPAGMYIVKAKQGKNIFTNILIIQ